MVGMCVQRTRVNIVPERVFQESKPLGNASRQSIRMTQPRCDPSPPIPVVTSATQGQALVEDPDGMRQVPLDEIQQAEAPVGHSVASACSCGEAKRLLPVGSALSECPTEAHNQRQPRSRRNSIIQVWIGRASLQR